MRPSVGLALTLSLFAGPLFAQDWKIAPNPVLTRWAKDVSPDKVHPEYPRPQMVREHWLNLNGLWEYAIVAKDAGQPTDWSGRILVPFPVESALSGVKQFVGPDKALWYRRSVSLPADTHWQGKNILLHFGAVDWETTVWVDGEKVGEHRGGFDPISLDITEALSKSGAKPHEIVVRVWDPSDAGYQPRGKQVQKPHGIWYTPVTGIWQTVWLEPVPKTYIRGVTITPNLDQSSLTIAADVVNPQPGWKLGVYVASQPKSGAGQSPAGGFHGKSWQFEIDQPHVIDIDTRGIEIERHWWSPEHPHLIDVYVALVSDKNADLEGFAQQWMPKLTGPLAPKPAPQIPMADWVKTYSAFRKISLGKDEHGVNRLLLNNKPLFQYGPLDQGWWPDGLYTAPTDEALKFDIEITKQYGFNMIRKHVKVEPARWYYWADKLGMLVWQDMPSGDTNAKWDPFGKFDGTELTRSVESAECYRKEWKAIIDARRNHPSIVMWVPFNEAWGQFDTVAVTKWTKEYDPSRLVNCASGGNDFPVGDVIDVHRYPGPFAPKPTAERAAVLGEYGGLGLPMKGHTWQDEKNWGYRSFTTQADLAEAYLDLLDKLHPMIENGLAAAIYTQTTDVEIEVNGLLTYDRDVEKIPVKAVAEAHRKLWGPAPKVRALVPTSQESAQTWKYTTEKPAGDDWAKADFDDSAWKPGPGGFGEKTTPGTVVRTEWLTPDIWARRSFELKEVPAGQLRLMIHHDEDAEIYLNGVLIKRVVGYTTGYQTVRLPEQARQHFRKGQNTLAVHCHQTGGGQYIDVGFAVAE
ncbi:glycoside hydrolase family 2 protein [Planctellipticum variicoloris]|uniref:glycoside hydrolase family 2 protein n=1 Tax=Planctellipticum variicoloris TaxID=3064265 RepID=UPI0030136983|nr:hypothetical protein SH412_003890 [Planctomycetaceae bacterium SH412]